LDCIMDDRASSGNIRIIVNFPSMMPTPKVLGRKKNL
jgi:hypothetical protein